MSPRFRPLAVLLDSLPPAGRRAAFEEWCSGQPDGDEIRERLEATDPDVPMPVGGDGGAIMSTADLRPDRSDPEAAPRWEYHTATTDWPLKVEDLDELGRARAGRLAARGRPGARRRRDV
jgi:hypothetical protein